MGLVCNGDGQSVPLWKINEKRKRFINICKIMHKLSCRSRRLFVFARVLLGQEIDEGNPSTPDSCEFGAGVGGFFFAASLCGFTVPLLVPFYVLPPTKGKASDGKLTIGCRQLDGWIKTDDNDDDDDDDVGVRMLFLAIFLLSRLLHTISHLRNPRFHGIAELNFTPSPIGTDVVFARNRQLPAGYWSCTLLRPGALRV